MIGQGNRVLWAVPVGSHSMEPSGVVGAEKGLPLEDAMDGYGDWQTTAWVEVDDSELS